jgi:hypothetical protein
VPGGSGQTGDPNEWLGKNREKRSGINFRHLFASRKSVCSGGVDVNCGFP